VNSEKLNDWLQLIGMAGIIGSLIFVGLELRQSQRVALNEAASITIGGFYETRSAINEHADVWAKGNAGRELSESEFVIYENLIRNMHTQASWAYRTGRRLGSRGAVPAADLAGFLVKHPPALEVWSALRAEQDNTRNAIIDEQDNLEFSVRGFDDLVRANLEKLREQSD